jgi:hypothetical protein
MSKLRVEFKRCVFTGSRLASGKVHLYTLQEGGYRAMIVQIESFEQLDNGSTHEARLMLGSPRPVVFSVG